MQRIELVQPDMAIDAGPLVEPTLAERRVRADGDHVAPAVVQHVGEIDDEAGIPAVVARHDVAVAEHEAVAEHALELEMEAPAEVRPGDVEHASVPADARVGKLAAERLVAVRGRGILGFGRKRLRRLGLHERQRHAPVVRQVDGRPIRVVEIQARRVRGAGACLGVGPLVQAETEIARRIGRVAQMEPPAEVEEQPFARARCNGGVHRRRRDSLRDRWQRVRRRTSRDRRRGGDSQRHFQQLAARQLRHSQPLAPAPCRPRAGGGPVTFPCRSKALDSRLRGNDMRGAQSSFMDGLRGGEVTRLCSLADTRAA